MRKPDLYRLATCIAHSQHQSLIDYRQYDLQPLQRVSLDPLITRLSLSELDMARILEDPKLRHDLNFEESLTFKPNYVGESGQKKVILAEEYWRVLAVELAIYMECNHSTAAVTVFERFSKLQMPQRLPRMFKTIQEILKTLVRGDDVPSVDQALDVEHLMQQLSKGACDLISLTDWLEQVLKRACSCARDQLVTDMAKMIRGAVHAADPVALVGGIGALFGVLETMKLVRKSSSCDAVPADIFDRTLPTIRFAI